MIRYCIPRQGEHMATMDRIYDQIIPQLPKKWLSHCVGKMAHTKVPETINRKIIKTFVDMYKINLKEVEKPLSEYKTLGDFFSRGLKVGARPINGDVVHPCDGVLIQSGEIHNDVLIQAKGKTFDFKKFIPENPWSDDFSEGSFFTYYLAPHNYHRVHSPIKGKILWSTLVPGELWPVNGWSVNNIDGLYALNERVAVGIETEQGKVILVMVGATNVGAMSFTFDPNIQTNTPKKKAVIHRSYSEPREMAAGEELGTFHLGSTTVVLYEKSWNLGYKERSKVLMGQRLDSSPM